MIFITQTGETQTYSKYSTSALVIENNCKAGAVVTHCYMAHRYKEHYRCYELLSQFSFNADTIAVSGVYKCTLEKSLSRLSLHL